jgi:hypothetical protein
LLDRQSNEETGISTGNLTNTLLNSLSIKDSTKKLVNNIINDTVNKIFNDQPIKILEKININPLNTVSKKNSKTETLKKNDLPNQTETPKISLNDDEIMLNIDTLKEYQLKDDVNVDLLKDDTNVDLLKDDENINVNIDVNIDLLKDDVSVDKYMVENINEFIKKEEEVQFSDDMSINFQSDKKYESSILDETQSIVESISSTKTKKNPFSKVLKRFKKKITDEDEIN